MGGLTETSTGSVRKPAASLRMSFEKVAENSVLYAVLHDRRMQEAFRIRDYYQCICPTATYRFDGEPKVYDILARRQRKDHRSSKKRLASSSPDHSIKHYTGKDISNEILNRMARLHKAEFIDKYGSSVFADDLFIEFLKFSSFFDL